MTGKDKTFDRDQAYVEIKNMIISGEIQTGEVTSVNELTERFNLGRSPVRDAILKLDNEGLVQVVPRKGIFISGIRLKDIKELFQLRLAIELYAVDKAVESMSEEDIKKLEQIVAMQEAVVNEGNDDQFPRSDEDFHIFIVSVLNNNRINQILEDSRRQMFSYGFEALTIHKNAVESLDEHKRIAAAIKKRDKEVARKEMMQHLTKAKSIFFE